MNSSPRTVLVLLRPPGLIHPEWLRRWRNNDFSALVVGLRWSAVHDDRGSFPRSLPLQKITLLGTPLAPEVPRLLGATVPSDASTLGFLKVGLHTQSRLMSICRQLRRLGPWKSLTVNRLQ
jgi:hypothetical protein